MPSIVVALVFQNFATISEAMSAVSHFKRHSYPFLDLGFISYHLCFILPRRVWLSSLLHSNIGRRRSKAKREPHLASYSHSLNKKGPAQMCSGQQIQSLHSVLSVARLQLGFERLPRWLWVHRLAGTALSWIHALQGCRMAIAIEAQRSRVRPRPHADLKKNWHRGECATTPTLLGGGEGASSTKRSCCPCCRSARELSAHWLLYAEPETQRQPGAERISKSCHDVAPVRPRTLNQALQQADHCAVHPPALKAHITLLGTRLHLCGRQRFPLALAGAISVPSCSSYAARSCKRSYSSDCLGELESLALQGAQIRRSRLLVLRALGLRPRSICGRRGAGFGSALADNVIEGLPRRPGPRSSELSPGSEYRLLSGQCRRQLLGGAAAAPKGDVAALELQRVDQRKA